MYKVTGRVVIEFEYGIDADSKAEAMELAEYFLNDDFHIGEGLSYLIGYTSIEKENNDEV